MKVIQIDDATQLVVDNIAYIEEFNDPDGSNSYIAVSIDGTTYFLTQLQFEEIKAYLNE